MRFLCGSESGFSSKRPDCLAEVLMVLVGVGGRTKVEGIGRRKGIGTIDDGRGCAPVERVGAGIRGAANVCESVDSLLCFAGVESGTLVSTDVGVDCRRPRCCYCCWA